jgi:3-hydroxy-9,10-secoandrosta-1,3,5(10)-triene-9,17-dione monooxygenase
MSHPVPTEAEIVARAHALIPVLRERAEATEKARCVPKETVDAFHEAGFFRILQPKRWGGYEMHPNVLNRVLMELARGCPSSAWIVMVLGVHPFEFGVLDPRAGDELWGKDNSLLVSSSYAPFGKVKVVEGGYILNGEWLTSSGCDHSHGGAVVGGRILDDQGRPVDYRAFWVPRDQYEFVDDWHVVGLQGTGSKRLRFNKDVFVPAHRSHSIHAYSEQSHGHLESPLYRLPFFYIFYVAVSSVLVGMAQGMADLYIEHMGVRQNISQSVGAAAQNPYVKSTLGRAEAIILAAKARLLYNTDEAWSYTSKGGLVPQDVRIRHFTTNQFTGGDCFNAAHMLFKKTATRGAWLSSPIQRQMRDILVGANHVTQNSDDMSDLLGGQLLGNPLPPGTPFSS